MQGIAIEIYQQILWLCVQYRILLTIGIPRNVNKKSSGEIICVGRKGGVSLQRHDKLLQTTTTRGWGDEFAE